MSENFRTTDVDLAAYLVCKHERLHEIVPPDVPPPYLCDFVFASSDRLRELVEGWKADDGDRLVDALEFARQRTRVYKRARKILDQRLAELR